VICYLIEKNQSYIFNQIYLISYKQNCNELVKLEAFENIELAIKLMKKLMRDNLYDNSITDIRMSNITDISDKSDFIHNTLMNNEFNNKDSINKLINNI
jgi:virulence-associated protein VapD